MPGFYSPLSVSLEGTLRGRGVYLFAWSEVYRQQEVLVLLPLSCHEHTRYRAS
ncbi:hypothetical protein OIDMADRAFT_18826 [Oidiodendron maius Zn]|uniref:Uncharacterized protein n=1 Tax=Oidiodendron maius (strain Zn) TaxID=913774 RepID=A0A0C3CSZ3_OIDMZ|nr:hypothetical protein OIDMADRAFT_18826 [Oidiodendron maius Zn]